MWIQWQSSLSFLAFIRHHRFKLLNQRWLLLFQRILFPLCVGGSRGTRHLADGRFPPASPETGRSISNPQSFALWTFHSPLKDMSSQIISLVLSQCVVFIRWARKGPKSWGSGMFKRRQPKVYQSKLVNNEDNDRFSALYLKTFRSDFLFNLISLRGPWIEHEGFFDMHVCFFTKARHGCIYILPNCNCIHTAKCFDTSFWHSSFVTSKTKTRTRCRLFFFVVTRSFLRSLTVGSVWQASFFCFSFYQRYALKQGWTQAADDSSVEMHNATHPRLLFLLCNRYRCVSFSFSWCRSRLF